MLINIDELTHFHEAGKLAQGAFGDAKETACLMSALTGETTFNGCQAQGWPLWLAELGAALFDAAHGDEAAWTFAQEFSAAAKSADNRRVDWDSVFRAIRLDSILPIALAAIGDGAGRDVVQACIAGGGIAADAAYAAYAVDEAYAADAAYAAYAAYAVDEAYAAYAADAAYAAYAEDAAYAAGAVYAAYAAYAAYADDAAYAEDAVYAAGAAWAAAFARITDSTLRCIRAARGRHD